MLGGGVDWTEKLQAAKDALLGARTTCAERATGYKEAQQELKEYTRANPDDTVSDVYKELNEDKVRAYAAYQSALKQVHKAEDGVNEARSLAGAQAPQSSPDRASRGSKRSADSDSGSKRRRMNDDTAGTLARLLTECELFEQTTSTGKSILLQRGCYITTLERIAVNEQRVFAEGVPYRWNLFPVGGTTGVGKTIFRLWVLAQWLRAKKSQDNAGVNAWLAGFDAVCYDDNNNVLRDIWITEEGEVCAQVVGRITPRSRTLLLLEWTQMMSGRLGTGEQLEPSDSVAIVTGSRERFVRRAMKEHWRGPSIYLPTWSTEELAEVFEFSVDKFHERGGVSRLWKMIDEAVHEYIGVAVRFINAENPIKMLSGTLEETSHVHRILDIGANGEAVGFISKAVADKVMARAVAAARGNIDAYVSRVAAAGGVFAKTFIGHMFEALFSSAFGRAETGLTYTDGTKVQVREGGDCVPFAESLQCGDGVLYKPEKRNFHGIDCFVLQGETVIMLQVTVGKTHTPVSEEHPDIKKLTNTFSNKRFLLVYVVPSAALAATFTVPQGNPRAWTVHVGHPENDDFAPYGDKLPNVSLPTETPLRRL